MLMRNRSESTHRCETAPKTRLVKDGEKKAAAAEISPGQRALLVGIRRGLLAIAAAIEHYLRRA
jgi:hypothetical protein